MTILKIAGAALAALLLVWSGGLAYLSYTAKAPEARLLYGQLRPCPATPNCVSSESGDASAHIEPLRFEGSAQRAWDDLAVAIRALDGAIVEQRQEFLWATFTSRVFRFVDDMEFRMVPEQGLIHLRSASRAGTSDMGVNRERVAQLRRLFVQLQRESAAEGGVLANRAAASPRR